MAGQCGAAYKLVSLQAFPFGNDPAEN